MGLILSSERMDRRLAAVLAADVAGYRRLMGLNEERTLANLKSFRKTLVDPSIAAHRGRIVKTSFRTRDFWGVQSLARASVLIRMLLELWS
jgi:adenylate cyclase